MKKRITKEVRCRINERYSAIIDKAQADKKRREEIRRNNAKARELLRERTGK